MLLCNPHKLHVLVMLCKGQMKLPLSDVLAPQAEDCLDTIMYTAYAL